MHSLQFGPFAVSLDLALLALGMGVALVAGALMARGRQVPTVDSLLSMALVGLVAARLVFVLRYLPEYQSAPWTIIDIRDGGFDAVGGLFGMAAYASWKVWRSPALRAPLAVAVAAGLISWTAAGAAFSLLDQEQPSVPDVALTELNGKPIQLDELAQKHSGQPVVVNLWASWCPPCRKEMPMLAEAQKRHTNVLFVFANQGENKGTVEHFLEGESLSLNHVLLDPGQRVARAMGSQAFPTTLFFDAEGQLVNRHMGMLSKATLARALNQFTHPEEKSDSP